MEAKLISNLSRLLSQKRTILTRDELQQTAAMPSVLSKST